MNIAVDLRGNAGGDSSVASEFLTYLNINSYDTWDCDIREDWKLKLCRNVKYVNKKKDITFQGNVYVATDIFTYSAAMDFAMLIKDNHLGILVGKASGNMPDSYGDCICFQLPNSKLLLNVSYKKWYRVDRSKSNEPIIPDIETDSSKALDKIYELVKESY